MMMTQYNTNNTPLTPGCYDVICARGKMAKNHSGNRFYQRLITDAIPVYNTATSKADKSKIVDTILQVIASNNGAFVKQQAAASDGVYYQVSTSFAREKIGQNLRDKLSTKYKSSTKAKRKRRRQHASSSVLDMDNIIQSNQFVTTRMDRLTTTMESNNTNTATSTPELYMHQLFLQTNQDLLDAFKNNDSLVDRFNKAAEVHDKEKQVRQ